MPKRASDSHFYEAKDLSDQIGQLFDGRRFPVVVTAMGLQLGDLMKQGLDLDHLFGLMKGHPAYKKY